MRTAFSPRFSTRLLAVSVVTAAACTVFMQHALAQRVPIAAPTDLSCEELRRQFSATERGTPEYTRLRSLLDTHCLSQSAPTPTPTPLPLRLEPVGPRESCDELLRQLRDSRIPEQERMLIQRRWQNACVNEQPESDTRPLTRCDALRAEISRTDAETEEYATKTAEYARTCMDTSLPQLLPLPLTTDRDMPTDCEALREAINRASPDSDEQRRLRSSYNMRCNAAQNDSALLRAVTSSPPAARCAELRVRMTRHVQAGSTDSSEYAEVREEFASSCMPAEENPCLHLRSALAALERTPTEQDRALLARLCASDERPAIPDRRLFCVRMRTHMEEQGDVSAEDRALYYRACFPHNNHTPDPSPCRELRERIVRLLNTREHDAEELATLRQRFQESCTAARSVPPAGFEENVLTSLSAYANPFPDTEPEDDEGKAAIELYRRGVIGGFPDGEFKGDRPVNRAEAAKFLLLACNRDTDAAFSGRLRDIIANEWYTPFVEAAAAQGIIGGYPDGTFRPANTVNRAEFLKMLTLACNLETNLLHTFTDVSASDWFDEFAGTAARYDLYDGDASTLLPGQLQSRRETAVAIYRYLQKR